LALRRAGKKGIFCMIKGSIIPGCGDIVLCKALRTEVFVEEQGFSAEAEFDKWDAVALHALIFEDGVPAATGRLYDENGVFHAGRFAVKKELRGRGLGDLVVRFIVNKAFELGAKEVHVGAQEYAVPFYEKIGFCVCGDKYMEEHVPHLPMKILRERFMGACGHSL